MRQNSEISKLACHAIHRKLLDSDAVGHNSPDCHTDHRNPASASCLRSNRCGDAPQTVLSTLLLRTNVSLCGRTELQLTGSIPANCIETKHVALDHSHKFVSLKQQIHKDLFLYCSFSFLQRILV